MIFSSATTAAPDPTDAAKAAAEHVRNGLEGQRPDLAVAFFSGYGPDAIEGIVATIQDIIGAKHILGCTSQGAIGTGIEIEDAPCIALVAGVMPGVEVTPIRMSVRDKAGDVLSPEGLAIPADDDASFIVLADPYSCEIQGVLRTLEELWPRRTVIGGMASGGLQPGANRLVLDGELYDEGLVAVALRGDVDVAAIVSQGCRPIGSHFVITVGEGNVMQTLGGRSALEVLEEVLSSLSDEDRDLSRQGVFVGRVLDEHKSEFSRGDFLIQGIIGVDRSQGAIAISGELRAGQTIQFHVRDAASADEDLRELLKPEVDRPTPSMALIFTCNGRGTRMWEEAGHDAGVVEELLGPVPAAGFFCAGELGPIGGRNFVHGFTASIGVIRAKE